MKFKDITGKSFGRLTARWPIGRRGNITYWLVSCQCGTLKNVSLPELTVGRTKACGCLHKEAITIHGYASSPTYTTWEGMIQRCCNQRHRAFKDYGGRGITVCTEWRVSFINFLRDMGERPSGLTLDRKNNDGNYEPGNCRWADWNIQNSNKRNRK